MVPGGQADEPAPEKQVAALSEQHRLAAIQGDTKALDAVLADDWVVVGPPVRSTLSASRRRR
jgi:hypothetical protein